MAARFQHTGARATMIALVAAVVVGSSLLSTAQGPGWRAYVTNFDGDGISVVDLDRRAVIATVKTGRKPHGVVVAPDGSNLFVSNEGDGTLTIIDPVRHRVRATVPVGGAPHQIEITRDGRHVLVPLNDKAAVAVFDVAAGRVVRTIPVGRAPHIIRHLPGSDRYLVTSEGDAKLVVLGAEWRVVGEIPIFAQPRVPAITPAGDRIYQTIRWLNGALVVDPAKGMVVDRIALGEPRFAVEGKDAHGVAVTPDGTELWIATQTTDSVSVVDARDHQVRGQLPVGRDPNWIEITADGATAVISNTGGNSVTLIDVRGRRVLETVPVGPGPKRLAVAAAPPPE